jgi:hypothetical protein
VALQTLAYAKLHLCGNCFNPQNLDVCEHLVQYAYMKIHVHIEDPIVELVDKNGMPSDAGGYVNAPNFTINAKDLGFTTLYVSSRFDVVPFIFKCMFIHFSLCFVVRDTQTLSFFPLLFCHVYRFKVSDYVSLRVDLGIRLVLDSNLDMKY